MVNERRRLRQGARSPFTPGTHGGLQGGLYEAQQARGLSDRSRAGQMDALGMAQDRAMGEAPSLAQAQLAAGSQQAAVNALGQAAQGRGGSLAAQGRAAQGIAAGEQMGMAQQGAMLRAQEQQQAEQLYAQQANQMAQMDLQRHLAAQGQMQGLYGQVYGGEMQAGLANRGMDINQLQAQRQFGLGLGQQISSGAMGLIKTGFASDAKLKKRIRNAEKDALDAFRELKPVGYVYKSEADGATDRETTGILAQDLERSRSGRNVVKKGERGKMVGIPEAISLSLAGIAALTKKVDALTHNRSNLPPGAAESKSRGARSLMGARYA